MKAFGNSLKVVAILVTAVMLSGWGGGKATVNEIENAQERAFQAARSCANGDYLDACDDALKYYKESGYLLVKHQDEIFEGARNGDKSYQKVIDRAQRLQLRVDELIKASE
jgi:hypothetical protein